MAEERASELEEGSIKVIQFKNTGKKIFFKKIVARPLGWL